MITTMRFFCFATLITAVALLVGASIGCDMARRTEEFVTPPHPVTAFVLQQSDPARRERVAGSVESWKAEEIGFEVAGRVEFVIEPETDVVGRVYQADGQPLNQPTVLARLDATRYQLDVQSVEAEIEATRQQEEALQIEIDQVFPARQRGAIASRDLAQTEVERNEKLVGQNAAPERALDLSKARLDSAEAEVAQVEAEREAKRAELAALTAQRKRLEQSLAEAQRNLADCTLYSPYSGQSAEVHVIPGGFVERGDPVVTVQLMDPISVQFEVSRETLKRLGFRDSLSIFIPQPDGTQLERRATVYQTDPVADPGTRTYTVTLLTPNEKVEPDVPAEMDGQPIVRTANIWRIMQRTIDGAPVHFIDENSFQQDAEGTFLWRITNRRLGTPAVEASPWLQVEKLRVERGERRVDFLGGLYTFQELSVAEGQEFDLESDMVTGRMTYPAGIDAARWEGGTVLLEQNRWLLRPGDLVAVDLSGRPPSPGFYVPLDAILNKAGKSYVFLVDSSGPQAVARQVEVRVGETLGTLRRIESVEEGVLAAGESRIVRDGALFLRDGEPLNVTRQVEVGS